MFPDTNRELTLPLAELITLTRESSDSSEQDFIEEGVVTDEETEFQREDSFLPSESYVLANTVPIFARRLSVVNARRKSQAQGSSVFSE